ncbi:hypothetical protein [Stygiolobus caldivivus]|uniref:hypothetical protein n=1 Tax=Stygiolobus caldivivus TaxID=2824673 RepID=UPI001C860B15|nr:hypothetical protein [Stygiolobus caldivivus]
MDFDSSGQNISGVLRQALKACKTTIRTPIICLGVREGRGSQGEQLILVLEIIPLSGFKGIRYLHARLSVFVRSRALYIITVHLSQWNYQLFRANDT